MVILSGDLVQVRYSKMTTKADVTKSNQNVDQARVELTKFWDKTLDHAGNFEWTFGDPSATSCTNFLVFYIKQMFTTFYYQ